MESMSIEIPAELKNDFIEAAQRLQDKYYVAQAAEAKPEEKEKHIKNFMALADILSKLELLTPTKNNQ